VTSTPRSHGLHHAASLHLLIYLHLLLRLLHPAWRACADPGNVSKSQTSLMSLTLNTLMQLHNLSPPMKLQCRNFEVHGRGSPPIRWPRQAAVTWAMLR
jgi:hypothetical protein